LASELFTDGYFRVLKKAQYLQMRWRETVHEVQKNQLQILRGSLGNGDVHDGISESLQLLCLMRSKGCVRRLQRGRDEVRFWAEVIASESNDSTLQVVKSALQIFQPSVTALGHRRAEQTD
jgi:hypothetical protein